MDIVLMRLPEKSRFLVKLITSILGIFLCSVLGYFSAKTAVDFHLRKLYYPTLLEMPKAPLIGAIALGFALTSIEFLRKSIYYYTLLLNRETGKNSPIR
jgi:TRAP-type C4-dicarboxylate transport system permease small subunit